MSQTIVLTGANRGLGLDLARCYTGRGDHVIAGCRNPAAATELTATGATVLPIDTADPTSIKLFIEAVGGQPVHLLINNAGIDARAVGGSENERGALQLDADQFDAVMRVNVTGPFRLVQGLAPNLRAARGKVVNISSQIASFAVATKMGRDVSYAASKAALNMVTLKQAQVLAPDGVTVICMHPGWLRTEMGGASADLDPADAAATITTTIDAVSFDQNGSFLRWDGSVHPW